MKFEQGKYVMLSKKDAEQYESGKEILKPSMTLPPAPGTPGQKVLVRVKDKNLRLSRQVQSPFVNVTKQSYVP